MGNMVAGMSGEAERASPQALAAVRAAKNASVWGWSAAYLYGKKRGVSLAMWYNAVRIELLLAERKAEKRRTAC